MTDVTVREATAEDLARVSRLWEEFDRFQRSIGLRFPETEGAASRWASGYERILGRFGFVWIAEAGGSPCGFVAARIKRVPEYLGGKTVGEVSDLYVTPDARRGGTARRLAACALERLKSLGVESIEVQVLDDNADALAFWLDQGFERELIQLRVKA